jgi:hypothetical protein
MDSGGAYSTDGTSKGKIQPFRAIFRKRSQPEKANENNVRR